MHSHLTRLVFRRIASSEPIVHRDCLRRASKTRLPRYNAAAFPSQCQRRSLWGFSRKPQRQVKEADIAPGLEKMLELSKMQKLRARPPSPAELAKAFKDFFRSKKRSEPVTDIEATQALRTLQYLLTESSTGETQWLEMEDLHNALSVLSYVPKETSDAHKELALALYNEIEVRAETAGLSDADRENCFNILVKVVSLAGDSAYARTLLETAMKEGRPTQGRAWLRVVEGFSKEGNEEELLRTIDFLKKNGLFYYKISALAAEFFAEKDRLDQAKPWCELLVKQWKGDGFPTALVAGLKCAIRNNDMEWGQSLVNAILMREDLPKAMWDVIFVWAAGSGKGVEEIDRMMEVMVRRNSHLRDGESERRPDIDTFNRLIEYAMSRNDSYSAERYLALGKKWDVEPNATTFILQMNYRISVNDLDGARAAYEQLQAQEVHDNEKYVEAANRLVQAMCASKRYDFDTIMAVVEDLNEQRARFAPATVSALCLLHLSRDELYDVIDLLQTHTFHYSADQRAQVRDTFVAFCLDRSNSTARAWDAYMIFQQFFGDADRDIRTRIMNGFFARRRPDMACHVFGHMRSHQRDDVRPTVETYVAALEGIAGAADEESLELVHNQLKLDAAIEPSTRLYNALMLAHTACEMPRRALDFWEDIVNSREGPSYGSIHIAFRACERAPFGERTARGIWRRLRGMDVVVERDLFASYVGALAGNSCFEEVNGLLEGVEGEFGFSVDAFVLGTYFNATYGVNKQETVEKWCRERYPDIWAELEKIGMRRTNEGMRLFKIDRTVHP